MKSMQKARGFTIVELLIVIVVIGILAAIVIVAYNGVQQRAENSVTISGVTAYIKALSLYATENDQYPTTSQYPCLGSPTGGVCARLSGSGGCSYSGGTAVNSTFDSDIIKYLGGSKPAVSNQTMTCTNGEVYRGAYVNRNDTNNKSINIVMYLKNTDCPNSIATGRITGSSISGELRKCNIALPDL